MMKSNKGHDIFQTNRITLDVFKVLKEDDTTRDTLWVSLENTTLFKHFNFSTFSLDIFVFWIKTISGLWSLTKFLRTTCLCNPFSPWMSKIWSSFYFKRTNLMDGQLGSRSVIFLLASCSLSLLIDFLLEVVDTEPTSALDLFLVLTRVVWGVDFEPFFPPFSYPHHQ